MRNFIFEQNKSNDLTPTQYVEDQRVAIYSIISGSDQISIDSTSLLDYSGSMSDSSIRISGQISIPQRHFEIKRETFRLVSQYNDELKNGREALKPLSKDLLLKAVKDEMKSMKSNHV